MALSEDPGWRGSIVRFWRRPYIADYIGFIILLAGYIACHIELTPFHRMFSLDDRTKQYPHAAIQRVSSPQNVLYAGVTPLVLLVLWAVLFRPGFHAAHVTIFGLFISLFLTTILTNIVKNAVGRPRPDLIARCKPALGTPADELVTIDVCTETNNAMLQDGFRSFPSGHSSWAFSGLGYLALFLAGQMHVFRPRVDLLRIMICLVPLIGAALIAMSRVSDYRHDVFDVSVGSLLGMLIAYLLYRKYYRGLQHQKCNVPYPASSTAETSKGGGDHVRITDDDEQPLRDAANFSLEDSDDENEGRSEILPLHNVRQDS